MKEKIEQLCAAAKLCNEISASVTGYGVYMVNNRQFAGLFGQGEIIERDCADYPYEHYAFVDGVKVYCIGGKVL